MKRKLIKRNKNYISSTMGKYDGNLSWQRVCGLNYKGNNFDDFCEWMLNPNRNVQWSYMWLVNTKVLNEMIMNEEFDYDSGRLN